MRHLFTIHRRSDLPRRNTLSTRTAQHSPHPAPHLVDSRICAQRQCVLLLCVWRVGPRPHAHAANEERPPAVRNNGSSVRSLGAATSSQHARCAYMLSQRARRPPRRHHSTPWLGDAPLRRSRAAAADEWATLSSSQVQVKSKSSQVKSRHVTSRHVKSSHVTSRQRPSRISPLTAHPCATSNSHALSTPRLSVSVPHEEAHERHASAEDGTSTRHAPATLCPKPILTMTRLHPHDDETPSSR